MRFSMQRWINWNEGRERGCLETFPGPLLAMNMLLLIRKCTILKEQKWTGWLEAKVGLHCCCYGNAQERAWTPFSDSFQFRFLSFLIGFPISSLCLFPFHAERLTRCWGSWTRKYVHSTKSKKINQPYFEFNYPNSSHISFKVHKIETSIIFNYGHTRLKVPDPVRSPKSSRRWPGQYYGGGPHGNTGCCSFFFPFFFVPYHFVRNSCIFFPYLNAMFCADSTF